MLANLLQNNGRPAHQQVDHVHFHYIPKPADAGDKAGLVVGWPSKCSPTHLEAAANIISPGSKAEVRSQD